MLIGVLVVVALALLISAFLTGTTVLAGAALVVSLAAAVLYVIALRGDPDGASSPAAATDTAAKDTVAEDASEEAPSEKPAAATVTEQEPAATKATAPAAAKAPEKKTPEKKAPAAKAIEPAVVKAPEKKEPEKAPEPVVAKAPEKPAAPAVSELAGTTVVHVVPGRMRYHVQGCQVIDGQQVEDLTVDDARDEGFTACSRCAARGRSHATA